jgi:putative FmdB family regulatory protein
MPTYEYECAKCGAVFEAFQSMSASPLDKCVKCGDKKVRRLIGAGAGIIFKGSGFYATDYGKKTNPCSGSEKKSACEENKGKACGDCKNAAANK